MYEKSLKGWFLRLLVIISQTINSLILMGNPDETISARAYRTPWPRTRKVLDWLFRWEIEHCYKSHQRDVKFAKKILGQDDG